MRVIVYRKNRGSRLPFALCLIPVIAAAQLVNFRNDVTFQTPGDRLIRWPDGTGLTGTNYVAHLYYRSSSGDMVPVYPDVPVRFRPHTTTAPGTWSGAHRTINEFGPGSTVTLEVRFWDSRHGGTFEEAQTNGFAVRIPSFNYTVPPPGSTLMENFSGRWWLDCPTMPKPIIHVQPTNQTARAGSNVTLRVVAEYPCGNQWYFNGTPLPNGGGSTLTISNFQAANVGDYHVVVSNRAFVPPNNFTTSQVARVSLYGQAQLRAFALSGNRFVFQVPGDAGQTFVVETTTDLTASAPWIPIHTNSAPFWFTNSATAADQQRFYRAVSR